MRSLGRLITAMVTPFDERGEVDYGQAKKLALALLASGSEGLVVSGTTGESPVLTKDEKLRLFAEIKQAVGDRGHVIAGTGSYCTAESVKLSREAERAGADALLLVVPYYNKPTQEGLYRHFRAIAESVHLPCIVYNVPSRTVTSTTAETVVRLSQVDNIVAVKEASGNMEMVARIIAGARPGFLVYSGNDGDTFPIVAMGGYGAVSVSAHLVGRQIREMIDRLLRSDIAGAAAIYHQHLPLVQALFLLSNPVPVKYALNHLGFRVGSPRLPLLEADDKTAEAIRGALARCEIDLPVPAGV